MEECSLEDAPEVFERGRKSTPPMDSEQIKGLNTKIGELTIERNFLSKKLTPWDLP